LKTKVFNEFSYNFVSDDQSISSCRILHHLKYYKSSFLQKFNGETKTFFFMILK